MNSSGTAYTTKKLENSWPLVINNNKKRGKIHGTWHTENQVKKKKLIDLADRL
jgi:hypothetical protein